MWKTASELRAGDVLLEGGVVAGTVQGVANISRNGEPGIRVRLDVVGLLELAADQRVEVQETVPAGA